MELLYLLLFAFNSFGAFFLIVTGVTLYRKKKNTGGLIFLIFSVGYGLYQLFIQLSEAGFNSFSSELVNILTMTGSIIVFLTAPLLFFSILLLLDSAYQFKKNHLLLFLPAIPAVSSVLILGAGNNYGSFFFIEQREISNSIFLIFHTLYMTVYVTFLLLLMIKLAGKITKSNRNPIIRILSISFILTLGRDIADITGFYMIAGILMTSTVLYLYFVILFKPSFVADFSKQLKLQHYQKSRLTGFSIAELKSELDFFISESQSFLNPDLKSQDLASEIGLSASQLSELLNLYYDANFNQFINLHRIQYAKEIIESQSDLSVLEIALQSGFNSSSAFYSAYNRITGSSPRR